MFASNVMLFQKYGLMGILFFLWPLVAMIMIFNHHGIDWKAKDIN